MRAVPYLPAGIVLAIVDPGVGTDRRAIVVEVENGYLIGPDNGLLAPAVAMMGGTERAVAITNPDLQLVAPGATFAARDVFAPAAAHLPSMTCTAVTSVEVSSNAAKARRSCAGVAIPA